MNQISEMKKFVAREIQRCGNLELAYGVCKEANQRKIVDSKKESYEDSNLKNLTK